MSHISPTMDLLSMSCLMMEPMMMRQSLVQIITYQRLRNSSLSWTVRLQP